MVVIEGDDRDQIHCAVDYCHYQVCLSSFFRVRTLNIFIAETLFMRLQIESPHFEVSEKIIGLVENKFDHLGRMYNRINHCDIALRKEKNDLQNSFCIEAKIEVPGSILFAIERDKNFESALKKIIEDLDRQLNKYKEKLEAFR